jgi:hypothetical protein
MSERDIFTAARQLTDPAGRAAYLEEACGGDAGLRDRVEALLQAHEQPNSLLDAPAAELLDSRVAATRSHQVAGTEAGGPARTPAQQADEATASGSGVSGESWDRSSSQAKKRSGTARWPFLRTPARWRSSTSTYNMGSSTSRTRLISRARPRES